MRPVVLLAALVILLTPLTSVTSVTRGTAASYLPTSAAISNTPPTGQTVIVRSAFGIAFYNSTSGITIQPAFLFMNMTVTGSNSTGTSFSIDSGPSPISRPVSYITIGPSPVVTVRRLFTVTSGQAFLTSYGHLTIQATMLEVVACQPGCMVPNQIFNLYLTGPARIASDQWVVFTRLFGFLFSSQTSRIGLFFVVGVSPGDVNEIGTVDIRDLTTVASAFGADTVQMSTAAPSTSPSGYSTAFYADLDGDGRIDIRDLSVVGAYFGQTY